MGNGFRCPFFLPDITTEVYMRARGLAIAMFVMSFCAVHAQHTETNITLRNEKGAYATVLLGFDAAATSGIDASLGEFAIPGFPPNPAGLQAALIYRDNGAAVLAYRDFRPYPSSLPSADTFTLMTTPASDLSRGNSLIFTWAYPLQKGIDSIIISDLFGGIVYKLKLDAREADTLSGNAMNLENFRIITYTSSLTSDVAGEGEGGSSAGNAPIAITGESMVLNGNQILDNGLDAYIIDVQGRTHHTVLNNGTVDLSGLDRGVFAVTICDQQKKVLYRRLITKL
jgi:hypothetical protein